VSRALSLVFGLGGLVLLASGCGSYGGPFNFSVVNNLNETVVLRDCVNSTCTSANEPWTIKAGKVGEDLGVPDGVLRAERVSSPSGTVLGCVPFRFTKTPPSHFQVKLSEMVPCGDSAGSHVVGGHDWPPL
jgi:hypothetical protein